MSGGNIAFILCSMRSFYLLLGWSFFGLGAVGVVLPVLPTTPFMLIALWAFARSSKRFHDWLYTHRVFGPPLDQWRTHRIIPVKAKIFTLVTMFLSFGYLAFFSETPALAKAIVALFMLSGAVFVLSQRSRISR
ncbi:MAG: YbaN family protein [Thiogranum sp.]|nr:YbaN family protein [Thiogranum sp.]